MPRVTRIDKPAPKARHNLFRAFGALLWRLFNPGALRYALAPGYIISSASRIKAPSKNNRT